MVFKSYGPFIFSGNWFIGIDCLFSKNEYQSLNIMLCNSVLYSGYSLPHQYVHRVKLHILWFIRILLRSIDIMLIYRYSWITWIHYFEKLLLVQIEWFFYAAMIAQLSIIVNYDKNDDGYISMATEPWSLDFLYRMVSASHMVSANIQWLRCETCF